MTDEEPPGDPPSDVGEKFNDYPPPPECRWPEEIWSAMPMLAKIRASAYQRLANPEAVAVAVLNRLAVIASGYKVVLLPGIGGRPVQAGEFNGLIAAPGGGKGVAMDVARDLVPRPATLPQVKLDASIGSAEGLAEEFFEMVPDPDADDPNSLLLIKARYYDGVLLSLDEGAVLAKQQERSPGLVDLVTGVWSGEQLGFGYADKAKKRLVERHSYVLGINMSTQPDSAGGWVSPESAGQGLGHRFMWVPVYTPEMPKRDWYAMTDDEVVAAGLGVTDVDLLGVEMADAPVSLTPDLIRKVRTFREADAARFKGASGFGGHASTLIYKRAGNLAHLDGRSVVTVTDWEIAEQMHQASVATLAWMLEWVKRHQLRTEWERGEGDAVRAGGRLARLTGNRNRTARLLKRLVEHQGSHKKVAGCPWECLRNMISRPVAGESVTEQRNALRTLIHSDLMARGWVVQVHGPSGAVSYMVTENGQQAASWDWRDPGVGYRAEPKGGH